MLESLRSWLVFQNEYSSDGVSEDQFINVDRPGEEVFGARLGVMVTVNAEYCTISALDFNPGMNRE